MQSPIFRQHNAVPQTPADEFTFCFNTLASNIFLYLCNKVDFNGNLVTGTCLVGLGIFAKSKSSVLL